MITKSKHLALAFSLGILLYAAVPATGVPPTTASQTQQIGYHPERADFFELYAQATR